MLFLYYYFLVLLHENYFPMILMLIFLIHRWTLSFSICNCPFISLLFFSLYLLLPLFLSIALSLFLSIYLLSPSLSSLSFSSYLSTSFELVSPFILPLRIIVKYSLQPCLVEGTGTPLQPCLVEGTGTPLHEEVPQYSSNLNRELRYIFQL